MTGKKGYVINVFMIETVKDLVEVALYDGKIYEQTIILELLSRDADLHCKIVPVQFLAFSLIADEAVCGGK